MSEPARSFPYSMVWDQAGELRRANMRADAIRKAFISSNLKCG
jgi:hypothetical protein